MRIEIQESRQVPPKLRNHALSASMEWDRSEQRSEESPRSTRVSVHDLAQIPQGLFDHGGERRHRKRGGPCACSPASNGVIRRSASSSIALVVGVTMPSRIAEAIFSSSTRA